MPAASTTVYFDTPDLGDDSWSLMATVAIAPAIGSLPATVNATISGFDDTTDCYRLGPR